MKLTLPEAVQLHAYCRHAEGEAVKFENYQLADMLQQTRIQLELVILPALRDVQAKGGKFSITQELGEVDFAHTAVVNYDKPDSE